MATVQELIAEYDAAHAAFEATDQIGDPPGLKAAETRMHASVDALLAARPTEPGDMAAQVRRIASEADSGLYADLFTPALAHIAGQLEAMAEGRGHA
jgi:hypothetical protein